MRIRKFSAPVGGMLLCSGACAQMTIVDLGVLPGSGSSRAMSVSRDGSNVVGFSYSEFSLPRAFIWTAEGGIRELAAPAGLAAAQALGVSGDGTVAVGYAAEYEYSSNRVAVRWVGGVPEAIGPIGSHAWAVSDDSSTVVGSAAGGACRWTTGGPQSLGIAGAARAVSATGSVIAGGMGPAGTFRWSEVAGLQVLGPLQGHTTAWALAMDAEGDLLAGFSGAVYSGHLQGGLWRWRQPEGMTFTPGPPLSGNAYVADMTDDGEVMVGYTLLDSSVSRPLIWTRQRGAFELTSVLTAMGLDLSGWHIKEARGISGDGSVIAGWGLRSVGPLFYDRAFLITGVPPLSCYANCNGSTAPPVLNAAQFSCFLASFASGLGLSGWAQYGHYANCDGSTVPPVLNVADFTCFLRRFAEGCP